MSNRTTSNQCNLAALASLLVSSIAFAGDNLDAEFNPLLSSYEATKLSAGTRINSSNIASFRQWLDDSVADLIADQALTLTLGPSLEIPIHPNYRKASEENLNETAIGDAPGELLGYAGGRPFLKLESSDPQAGLKAAWNMRYSYAPDETETEQFNWHYRDMRKDKI